MANLRDIRNRIISIENTEQITKAMKMVAASKLYKAQTKLNYVKTLYNNISLIIYSLIDKYELSHKVLENKDGTTTSLLVVIGSDKGLCGAFNNNLFRRVESFLKQKDPNKWLLLTIGRKAEIYFRRRGYSIIQSYSGFFDSLSYDHATNVVNYIYNQFISQNLSQVVLTYNHFFTVLRQEANFKSFLPLNINYKIKKNDILPLETYLIEPNPNQVLAQLFPIFLAYHFWNTIIESNTSEQAARVTAMDSAANNAKDLRSELKLLYNRVRQSAITTELTEIISGSVGT